MTTPNQDPSGLIDAIGLGAYQLGGGGYNFGQDMTEQAANAIIRGPAAFLADGIEDIPTALANIAEYLLELPLDALKSLQEFIPGTTDLDFIDVSTAVNTIMGALDTAGRMLQSVWQEFLDLAAGITNALPMDFLAKLVNLNPDGTFDASQLVNLANIPEIAIDAITGLGDALQAVQDGLYEIIKSILEGLGMDGDRIDELEDAVTYLPDKLLNSFEELSEDFHQLIDFIAAGAKNAETAVDTSISELADVLRDLALKAEEALGLSEDNTNRLNIRDNKHGYAGLESTVETSFDLTDLPDGAEPPMATCTSSYAFGSLVRVQHESEKGFIQWYGKGHEDISEFYVNIYLMDENGNLVLDHTSPSLKDSLHDTWEWITYVFPHDLSLKPGDVIGAEFVVVGSGTHSIAARSMQWMKNHPTSKLKRLGWTRSPSPRSPSQIAHGSINFNSPTPWMAVGISALAEDYRSNTTAEYRDPTTYQYTIPGWAKHGDEVDIVGIGGGGAGQGEQGYNMGQGGDAGSWASRTLVVGVDIAPGTTFDIEVGAGGPKQIMYFQAGDPGEDTTISYTDINNVRQTLTASGGDGGSGVGVYYNGHPAGDHEVAGIVYHGGGSAVPGASGKTPGGGGGGAPIFVFPGKGANGGAWITTRQVHN